MKAWLIFWFVGCVLVGLGAGLHENRCPNDPFGRPQDYFFTIATWPAGISWGIMNSKLPACKVPA